MINAKPDIDALRRSLADSAFFGGVPYRKAALTQSARQSLKVPETAQDGANLYSMANFAPIYVPALRLLAPRRVVEIGSEKGGNTLLLSRLTAELGAELHIVDPAPLPEDVELGPHVRFHAARSVEYLASAEVGDVYFVDGDHNYSTLSAELELIERARLRGERRRPVVILMHDVGWPNGTWDMYYDPDDPAARACGSRFDAGPVPWSDGLHGLGFAVGVMAVAPYDASRCSGLLAAVHGFLAASQGWSYLSIPAFYGLGILWRPEDIGDGLKRYLTRLEDATALFAPVLGTLEWNRLLLFVDRNYSGKLWEYQQAEIARQGEALKEAGRIRDEQRAEIARQGEALRDAGRIWGEQQAEIARQQDALKEAGRIRDEQQAEIVRQGEALRDAGRIWGEQQAEIARQRDALRDARRIRDEQQVEIARQGEALKEAGRIWGEQQAEIARQRDALRDARRIQDEQQVEIARLEQALDEASRQGRARLAEMSGQLAELRDLNDQCSSLRAERDARDAELGAVYASASWRFSAPLRSIGRLLMRIGR